MRYYCIDILPKFIKAILNSDSEVPDELLNNPLLNTETFNTYYRVKKIIYFFYIFYNIIILIITFFFFFFFFFFFNSNIIKK